MNDAALACTLIDRSYGDNLTQLFDDRRTAGAARRASGRPRALCAAVDAYPVIPIYQDRQITKLGPDRER